MWDDLGYQKVMEGAHGAYVQTGEQKKQIEVLKMLLKYPLTNINTRDWAHGRMAQLMASQGEYSQAILHLNAIEASGLPIKGLVTVYEKKQKETESKPGTEER